MENRSNTIVAISRQMASGGSYIGYLLAKKLNFKYVDREILREAAKNLGTDERTWGLMKAGFNILTKGLQEL